MIKFNFISHPIEVLIAPTQKGEFLWWEEEIREGDGQTYDLCFP